MSAAIKVGIAGAGRPGLRHAEGYKAAGGFSVSAVADLIPKRRQAIAERFGAIRQVTDAVELARDPDLAAISICLPTYLHLPIALAALKAGKHVICETPPALTAAEARKLAGAAEKSGKVLLFAAQRHFGAGEQVSLPRRLDAHTRRPRGHRLVRRCIQVGGRRGNRPRASNARARLGPDGASQAFNSFRRNQQSHERFRRNGWINGREPIGSQSRRVHG
jgi:hypothetical protein